MGNCIPLSRLILYSLILLFILFRFFSPLKVLHWPKTSTSEQTVSKWKVCRIVWDYPEDLRVFLAFTMNWFPLKVSCGHWVNCTSENWFILTPQRHLFIDRQIGISWGAFKLLFELNLSPSKANCIMKIQFCPVLFAQSISAENNSINVVKWFVEG